MEVGCGRAYLASQLALLHRLTVVGVEANLSYAQSAQQRIAKFSQQLPGLLRNAEEDLRAGKKLKRGKHYRSKQRHKAAKKLNADADVNGICKDINDLVSIDDSSSLEHDFNLLFTSSVDIGTNVDETTTVQIDDSEKPEQTSNVAELLTASSKMATIDVDHISKRELQKRHKVKSKNDTVSNDNIHLVTTKVTNCTRLDDILAQAQLSPGIVLFLILIE